MDRQFIQLGFLCFLILIPLAVTSFRALQKRMGKHWRRLHRSVYVAGILAVLHFFSLAKVGNTEPFYYILVLSTLLAHRVLIRWYRNWYRKNDDGMEVDSR